MGIPDDVPKEIFDMVPSYKRIAIAILKNDYSLKSLGFSPKTSEYYNAYKRIEIEQRNKDPKNKFVVLKPISNQLRLF